MIKRRGKKTKKKKKQKKNLPSNFVESFFKDFLDDIDFSHFNDFQQQRRCKQFSISNQQFSEEIQGELDLYVTNNRLNEVSFRRRFGPISKNSIRNKNRIELLFKDVKLNDAQNPVIGSLIKVVDVSKKKKKILIKFLDKASTSETSRFNRD